MRKLALLLAGIGILGGVGLVYAAPNYNIFRHLMPETTSTYDLGSPTSTWRNLYVDSCTGCGGSGNSAWTIGNGLIHNATSTDSVLVGTSTPTSATLFVQGSGTKNALTVTSSTGSTLLTVLPNGFVGIGRSPTIPLHVSSNNSGAGMMLLTNTNTAGYSSFDVTDNGGTIKGGFGYGNASVPALYAGKTYISASSGVNMAFLNGATETMTLNAGKVGIGTTTPAGKLTVGHTGSEGSAALVIGRTDFTTPNGAIRWAGSDGTYTVGIGTNFNVAGDALELMTGINQTRVTITSGGNVGIGTVAPVSLLHLSENNASATTTLTIQNSASNGNTAISFMEGGTTAFINKYDGTRNAFDFIAPIEGSTLFTALRTGNVGIGTTTPGNLLVLQSTSDLTPLFVQSAATNSTNVAIFNRSTGGRQYNIGVTGSANSIGAGKFFVYDNAAPAFRLVMDTSGNLVIGSTTPLGTARTSIQSSGNVTGLEIYTPGITSAAAFAVYAPASTSVNDGKAFTFLVPGEGFGRGMFYMNGAYGIGPGSSGRDTFISRSAANTLKVDSDLTSGFANLYVTGRIGIGSATPASLLSIQASTTQATLNPIWVASTSNATMLVLTPTGRFGLGTAAPTSLMHLTSNATTTVTWDSTSVTQGACIKIKDADGTGYTYLTVNNGVATYSTASCE